MRLQPWPPDPAAPTCECRFSGLHRPTVPRKPVRKADMPGDITAQHEHIAPETIENRKDEFAQPPAIFVEKPPCLLLRTGTVGNFLNPGNLPAGQRPIATAKPAGGKGIVGNPALERQVVNPSMDGDFGRIRQEPAWRPRIRSRSPFPASGPSPGRLRSPPRRSTLRERMRPHR